MQLLIIYVCTTHKYEFSLRQTRCYDPETNENVLQKMESQIAVSSHTFGSREKTSRGCLLFNAGKQINL